MTESRASYGKPVALPPRATPDTPTNGGGVAKRTRVNIRAVGKQRLEEMGFHKQVTGSPQATNLLYEAYGLASYLGPEHYHFVKQWAQLGALVPRLVERLYDGGLFKQDGDPLKANETLLRYMAELRAHAKEAGLTPTSQVALGVDFGRMEKLRKDLDDNGADDGDVADMEQRIVKRLRGEGDDAD